MSMRFAIALVLIGSTAYADPFEHRTQPETQIRYELVDPGLKQRDHAKLFLAGGLTLLTVDLVANLYWKHQYDKALAMPYKDIATANHYHDLSQWVGTGLFVVGAAAVGTAAYLYVTAEKDLVRKPIVAPMIGGDQAGVSLTGAF